jgi:hypothetical protein
MWKREDRKSTEIETLNAGLASAGLAVEKVEKRS